MTNDGGPGQDYLDFGYFAPIVVFLKFLIFAWIYAGARRLDPLCVCLFPAFFAAAITYTQSNVLYGVGTGMPVVVACLLVPLAKWYGKRTDALRTA
jgi:hypothetical protein